MDCPSKMKPVEAREAWATFDGVVALGWSNGVLLVEMQRGKATWRGERLRMSGPTLEALYKLAAGALVRDDHLSNHYLRMVRRKLAACGDFWTELKDGHYCLVQGWFAEKGCFVPPPKPEIEPVWEAPMPCPSRLDDGQRAKVVTLHGQGYRPVAIAAITRLPYGLITRCVTQHVKKAMSCDRKALDDRPVTPCHAASRQMSHVKAEEQA